MESWTIETTDTGSLVPENTLPMKIIPGFFAPDYAKPDNAADIDRNIRDAIKSIRLSILGMGLALAKMKAEKLYKDLGYSNISQYIEELSCDTQIDRSNIFRWLSIGEVYLKYREELESAGFCDEHGPTKLPYLERALEKNDTKTVFNNIKNMSVRDFISFAKDNTGNDVPSIYSGKWVVTEKGNSFYVNGKLAAILSGKVDERVTAFFRKLIHAGCEALEREGVILPVVLKNRREANRYKALSEILKEKLRNTKKSS